MASTPAASGDSHRSYYNRTGGAVVAGHNLPPKLGLYTITEREEELQLDDAYQQNGKLEMSGQHPQKQPPDDSGSGVPRASSLQGSDKFSAMYSSVPDMSSSGFHKSEETDQITGQESIESDMQTKVSEPKEESRTAGDTQTETKGTEQIVYEETEKVSNKTCLETSETDKYTLQDNFVTDHSVGHGFGKEKESVVQCLEFKELADETCESSFQSMSEMQPVMTSTPKQSLDELACQDENGLKSNLHLKQPDSHSGALPVTEPSDDIIRNGGENMSIQSLEEGNQQKKKLSAVAFSETVTVGVFPEENSTKPIISQEKLQIGENEDEKNLLDNVVFVEENPEDDESLSENKKETTEQEIQSGSQEKEQTKKPFSMDDVPVELRPYMPFDIDPEFMDDPESREDVYDMARQKMKEKERETKAAKLAEDLAARTGLPKGSLCPLSVKDSFDGGLNPADVLKRKMQPKPLMSGSHKAFPSSTFTLSVSGSNVSKLTVDSTPSQPLHSHTKHVSSDDLDSDDEAFIRSLKSPLSPLVIETQSQPLPPPQADASVKKLGGGSVVGPEDFLKRKQKAKVMKSLQHLDNGKLEQTELVSKTSTVQKEFGKSESGKHFNMDDVPEELRPYIPLDFNSEFMDDTESREEVYDMARQKIKEKELEQKSAKVAKELAARTGLPKGSICPLGVKDSFDTGLAAADVLKRKKLPLQMDGSTVIPSSTFTLSTDSGVSKLTNTEKILEGRSVPDSHIPSSQRPEQILPFENKKLSSGVKSSGGLRPSDLLKRKQKTDIIQAMKKSENGGALESIADKSIQSHDSDHADSASHEMESLGQNEVTEASKVQPTSSASQEQTEPIIPENSTGEVGYGNADFTNPAELLKHLEITDGENTKLSVLKEIDRNSSSDTKLSVLNKKREKHITESGSVSKSQPDIGKVSSLDSATQTVEIEEKEFTQIRKTSPTDDEQNYTTPSKPLIKTLDRQTEEEVSKSLGYSTVSQSLQTQEAKGASLDYTTPSKLLKKTLDREVTERNIKSPGYGEIEYTTPSQLIQRQESGNESLFHTTSSNLDTSFHRDVTENVSKLSEYGVTDYTTPSQLPQNTPEESSSLYDPTPSKLLKKSMDRDIAERSSRSPGYGGIDYTTPSQLLQEKSEDRSLDYSTPSKLLKKSMDRDVTERSSRSPGYGAIDYTTPSQLLREISKDSSLEYTTPSKLLKKSMDRDVTERSSRSPGYGAIDYTTPSQFLREKSKDRSLDYTTPSKLLKKSMDWDVTERSSRSPGYGAIDYTTPSQLLQEKDKDRSLDYTTPSKLLKKSMDRDITERSSRLPGYGEIDYTTPSQLLQEKSKDRSLEYTTPSKLLKKSMDRDVTERSSRSPGYGAIDYTTPSQLLQEKSKDRSLDYTTPSKLLKKSMDRDVTERSSRSPGYGEIDYTTPSQLLQEKSKDRSLEYTTPSKLLKKSMVRDITEMSSRSPGYCEIDYTTPSQLLQEKSKDRSLEYTTPSKLLKKSMDRNVTERSSRSPGYGEIDYKSPSQLLQEKSKDRSLDYTTPSKLLKKSMDRDVTERSSRSPGYGEIGYTTPSQLLQEKSEDRSLDYTTPSKLLKKSMDRDITERSSRSPGYGEIGYTTPSQLLQRQNVSEKSLGEYESSRSIKEFSVVTREDLLLAPDDIGYDTMEMAESSDSRSRTHHQSLDSLSNQSRTTESDLTVKDELDKQTQRILDSETYSDITTYYRRMSDLLMKIAREMRVKSEPHFIGMNSQIALDSVDSDGDSPGEKGHHPTPTGSDESGCWTESTWSRTYQGQSESKQPTTSEEIPGLTHDLNDTKICCDSEHTKTHETKPEEEKHDLEYQGSNYMFTPVVLATDSEDSHTKENKLKTRSSAMSSGYPLSVHSSYQERLLSSMDDSSISLTRNPSYLFRSSSTEDTSLEESLLEKEVSKMDREGISRHQQPHNIQKRHSRDHHKLHQLPERLPDDFQSLNELFWFLCMNHPDVCRSFHDSLDHLPLSCTTPEPCTPPVTQPSVHCTKLPDCTCMSCTRMPNGTHFHQGEKKSATGRSHVASRQSSRLPRPQKKLSQDLASGQKKKTLPGVRSTTPEARGYIMEKEMMESQNRKLQMEISTLQTENKLLKEKNNRAQAKIGDLEEQLTQTREELETLHSQLHQELTEVSRKSKSEAAKEIDQLQNRITSLTEENDAMRSDVAMLEKQLESAHKASDKAWQNSEKAKTLDAYKMEVITLKDEVTRVKSLLEQSERHLQEEEQRSRESNHSLLKLTEVKNLLQQQVDMGGGGATATDKQIKSLEKRLRITEERLHQERADRANNLSEVEDKLLTENARLQAIEKELSRQLQREKDKNRNLDQKVKDIREENEKLRLSLPFDESALISQKAKYDIPYGIHSTQRTETVKNPDYKHVLSQVEKEAGLKTGQEKDIICHIWSTREQIYHQLQQLEIILQDLNLRDNNITEGLKNLRDVKSQSDAKVHQLEEKLDNLKSEKAIFEATYKEQLTTLVNERHDAFARLKTAEDLMEAIRSENEILKSNVLGQSSGNLSASTNLTQTGQLESLQTERKELEGKNQQLMRSNILLEGEVSTLKVQLEARNKALEEAQNEVELAHNRLVNDEEADRKQQKIDKLTTQVSSLQSEVRLITDKFSSLLTEKNKLENDLQAAQRELNLAKVKVRDNKAGEVADSKQNQILREEIDERDRRIGQLSQECDELESQLQQVRQDLYAEQIQSQEYEAQLETYQQQVEQRGQMVDTLSRTEKEQLAQFQILKDTMDSLSQELSQKQAQNKVLQLELSKEKDKSEYMEKELKNMNKDKTEEDVEDKALPSHQLQIRELETERDQLKTELIQASTSLEQAAERDTAAQNEIKQLQQELTTEKGKVLHMSAEKGELEQNLEEIAEEHDALVQEKAQNEEDLLKLENKLEEVLQKLEMESCKHNENFTATYQNVPPEAAQMVGELESLRSLIGAKQREEDALKDRISRQQMEMDFMQRRVELLHNENECNREDVMRMTGEVVTKIKDGIATREMNQFLVKERDRLQKDNAQLEKDLEKERELRDRRKAEIADVIRKVERSEDTSKMTSRDIIQKDAIISSLESELREVKRTLQQQEVENSQLKNKSEHLSKDIHNLNSMNTSLENRLEAEKAALEEQKSQSAHRRDELMSTNHELELLKHDHSLTLNSLNAEKQTVENLKEEVSNLDDERQKLREEVRTLAMELESCKGQLNASRETIDNLKQDKGAIYHEYDSMVRKLNEKDEKIGQLQAKCDKTVEAMQKELTLQKHSLEKEKTSTERDLELAREEITSLNEEMKQKEAQLNSFGRTLQELEDTTRQKHELEIQVEKMESSSGDSSLLLESLRKETMSLQETIARQQEKLTQVQGEKTMLQDQLKIEKEKMSGQVLVLNKENAELRSQTEGEKSYLKDNLNSLQIRLSSVEANLASAIEARDKAQINSRMLERSLEETKDQLQDEVTSRKVAEQRAESLQTQLTETRKDRFLTEEKLGKAQTSLTKTEKELRTEKDRVKRLSDQTQELEATSFGHESSSKAKQDQIDLLQAEVGKLRQILESQKQQLNSKLKKTTLDMKQQVEILEEDRIKLTQQNQSLMSDLDCCREQVAVKNKENLKLQESILSLEEEMREQSSKLKQAADTIRAEEEMQAKLSSRYHAQEEELQKMKIYLSKKAEESGEADKSMWLDLNHLVQDMSRQLQEHMETQKSDVLVQKDQEGQLMKKYRKQVQDLESELSTEKALHNITKHSLQALEEDCQRLRHQLHAMRRRDNASSDKKYKNRMEAINEIIARSQAQAQAMLAASGYYDDTGVKSTLNSPRLDYHGSPDNSVASDIAYTGPMVIPPYQQTPSPPKLASSPRK